MFFSKRVLNTLSSFSRWSGERTFVDVRAVFIEGDEWVYECSQARVTQAARISRSRHRTSAVRDHPSITRRAQIRLARGHGFLWCRKDHWPSGKSAQDTIALSRTERVFRC